MLETVSLPNNARFMSSATAAAIQTAFKEHYCACHWLHFCRHHCRLLAYEAVWIDHTVSRVPITGRRLINIHRPSCFIWMLHCMHLMNPTCSAHWLNSNDGDADDKGRLMLAKERHFLDAMDWFTTWHSHTLDESTVIDKELWLLPVVILVSIKVVWISCYLEARICNQTTVRHHFWTCSLRP